MKPETVAWLRRELQRGELSRAALGRELCSRDGWRNPRGALCAASARKALPHLAEQLRLSLPRAQAGPPRRGCGPRVDGLRLALTEFCGSLEELGEVRLREADTALARKRCARLLEAAHPLGRARAPGCRLTYLLESAAVPLGVLSFVAGAGTAVVTVTAADGEASHAPATQAFTVTVVVDYDADADGLLEVRTLAQLDALRHDLDGDGVPVEAGARAPG